MPFGGKYQLTPVAGDGRPRFPSRQGETDACSVMAWGYNPYLIEKSPYRGARTWR